MPRPRSRSRTAGSVGGSRRSFDVTRPVVSAGAVTVDYTTTNGSATVANGDYDAASDTLTFDPGETTKTVDVTVHGDTTYETNEGVDPRSLERERRHDRG